MQFFQVSRGFCQKSCCSEVIPCFGADETLSPVKIDAMLLYMKIIKKPFLHKDTLYKEYLAEREKNEDILHKSRKNFSELNKYGSTCQCSCYKFKLFDKTVGSNNYSTLSLQKIMKFSTLT